MRNFKSWLETKQFTGLTQDDILWWAKYARSKLFKSPEEAREWVFQRREFADSQPHASVFGVDGPEFNRAYANAMPVYQSGKSWKIGKRIRTDNRFSWTSVDVRPNSLEDLETAGYVNMFDNPTLGPVQLVSIRKLYKTENHSETKEGQEYVARFVYLLRNGEAYFKAIVYGANGEIIDGHHRYEAAKLLKMTKIPAQQVILQE